MNIDKCKYVRVGNVPLCVEFEIRFGIPLLVSIRRLDGVDVIQYFSPAQLELICNTALKEVT